MGQDKSLCTCHWHAKDAGLQDAHDGPAQIVPGCSIVPGPVRSIAARAHKCRPACVQVNRCAKRDRTDNILTFLGVLAIVQVIKFPAFLGVLPIQAVLG